MTFLLNIYVLARWVREKDSLIFIFCTLYTLNKSCSNQNQNIYHNFDLECCCTTDTFVARVFASWTFMQNAEINELSYKVEKLDYLCKFPYKCGDLLSSLWYEWEQILKYI